jgi:P-type E1-E2 ATPase
LVEKNNLFTQLSPMHKEKIITALRHNRHVVGYLGDGINDAPALRAGDVGISVDSGANIAKESSDIILLEKNLMVLADGVMEGRRIFVRDGQLAVVGAHLLLEYRGSQDYAGHLSSILPDKLTQPNGGNHRRKDLWSWRTLY